MSAIDRVALDCRRRWMDGGAEFVGYYTALAKEYSASAARRVVILA